VDQILARHRSDDGLAFYLTDRMGSVRAIADTDGSVLSQTEYSSFGEIISQTNPEKADQFGFTGREFDPETDLYYYRARYYDPNLGRFISEDPIGTPRQVRFHRNDFSSIGIFSSGDFNNFRYVFNFPSNFIDPFGLATGQDFARLSLFSLRVFGTTGFIVNSVGAGVVFKAYIDCAENSTFATISECSPILEDFIKFGVKAVAFGVGRLLLLRGGFID